MGTREVTERQKSAAAVIASIEAHGGAAASVLEGMLKPMLRKGEAMPDAGLLLQLFARLLGRDGKALVAADDRNEAEKADDDAPRTERDDAAAVVREACVVARDVVASVYGDAALRALGMDAAPPPVESFAALSRWAHGASAKLRDEKVTLSATRSRGVAIDRAQLAEAIDEKLPTLDRALKDVERERRELESTQAEKNRAVERYDVTFLRTADLAAAAFRAADMPMQAERVKPSVRRPGRTERSPDDGDADPTPTPPATPR